jgi:hypothetical protein
VGAASGHPRRGPRRRRGLTPSSNTCSILCHSWICGRWLGEAGQRGPAVGAVAEWRAAGVAAGGLPRTALLGQRRRRRPWDQAPRAARRMAPGRRGLGGPGGVRREHPSGGVVPRRGVASGSDAESDVTGRSLAFPGRESHVPRISRRLVRFLASLGPASLLDLGSAATPRRLVLAGSHVPGGGTGARK